VLDPKPAGRVKDPEALRRFRLERMGEPCELCEQRPGTDVHHRVFRSQGGNDEESNLILLCRICHDGIHAGRIDRHNLG